MLVALCTRLVANHHAALAVVRRPCALLYATGHQPSQYCGTRTANVPTTHLDRRYMPGAAWLARDRRAGRRRTMLRADARLRWWTIPRLLERERRLTCIRPRDLALAERAERRH